MPLHVVIAKECSYIRQQTHIKNHIVWPNNDSGVYTIIHVYSSSSANVKCIQCQNPAVYLVVIHGKEIGFAIMNL
jgi:hypothetical protein